MIKKVDWSLSTTTRRSSTLLVIALITILASYLQYRLPLKSFDEGPARYTRYNNYVIFKQAHFHLLDQKDMYVLYPNEHHDLYKYSPAFALLFGLFSHLPDLAGLILWNLLNAMVLIYALMHARALWSQKLGLFILFFIPELVLATQHAQSNALMTGLLLLSYFDLEENKPGRAVFWVVAAAFIKIYAGLGAVLFLFYPGKVRYILGGILSTALFAFLPLIATTGSSLWMQYLSWWQLLTHDHDTSYGLSLMHILNLVFPAFHSKTALQLTGVAVLLVLLFPVRKFQKVYYRVEYLALILLTLILFNHKSESATFIVAAVGIGMWYFSKSYPSKTEHGLMLFAFLFTILIATDLFPPVLKKAWLVPYSVKVWSCILIYSVIGYDLLVKNKNSPATNTAS